MEPHVLCLALNMFFEAREQDPVKMMEGYLMVAEVTINRVEDRRYPDSICEVVWQPKQFSWTHDGLSDEPDTSTYHDRKAWEMATLIAEDVAYDPSALPNTGATHYHADYVSPSWASSLTPVGMVGDHIFYIWE